MWPSAMSQEQISEIIAVGESKPPMGATVFSEPSASSEVRSSTVRWINELWVRNLLWEYVKQANMNAFGVDVENYADMQFTEYHATQSGHYDWHHDILWTHSANSDRKLSITVQLSDSQEYAGGDFEFDEVETPTGAKTKGTILVFPSYLRHRVTPVTWGVRKSLVAWFSGPRWR